MYLSARVNTDLYPSTTCVISDSEATIGLTVTEEYFHALGAMHGSVYFKLLDDAAFFAVSSVVRDVFVLTTSFNIHLLRPVSSGTIRAEGRVIFKSRDSFVAEATLCNEAGKKVATGTGNFVKSKHALSPEMGYQ